jgi:hypothetical protein
MVLIDAKESWRYVPTILARVVIPLDVGKGWEPGAMRLVLPLVLSNLECMGYLAIKSYLNIIPNRGTHPGDPLLSGEGDEC